MWYSHVQTGSLEIVPLDQSSSELTRIIPYTIGASRTNLVVLFKRNTIILFFDYVLDNVHVFLPKYSLTTVKSRFNADELQLVRGEVISSKKYGR